MQAYRYYGGAFISMPTSHFHSNQTESTSAPFSEPWDYWQPKALCALVIMRMVLSWTLTDTPTGAAVLQNSFG